MPPPPGPRFWDLYSLLYDAFEVRPGNREALKRVVEAVQGLSLDRERVEILDLATGTGAAALLLAERGFRVLGIDFSRGMLSAARAKAERRRFERVRFRKVDDLSAHLEGERGRKLITWLLGLHLVEDAEGALGLAARALAPGGTLILTVPPGRMNLRRVLRDIRPVHGAARGWGYVGAAWVLRTLGRVSERMKTIGRVELEGLIRRAGLRLVRLEEVPSGPLLAVARRPEIPRKKLKRRARR